MESEELQAPIDQAQLTRIESTHKGFLYQHLYGTICLLSIGASAEVIVERDEDVELSSTDTYHYVQIKMRSDALQWSDISSAMERFATLRELHANGERQKRALFAIVSNGEPSPTLCAKLAASDWPQDVAIVTPARPYPGGAAVPAVPATIPEAIKMASELAAKIPYRTISATALVLKLAAIVQLAASGTHSHRFTAAELPALFEQLVEQLQRLPDPPVPYRSQEDEPTLASDKRIRLVTGLSGGGKTAFAAEVSRTSPDTCYFDATDIPSASLATALARQLAIQFVSSELEQVLLPTQGGMDMLRAIDKRLEQNEARVTVIFDNAQYADPASVKSITEALPNASFIFLAQPTVSANETAALLGVTPEPLKGWTIDSIAAEFATKNTSVTPAVAAEVKSLTAGLPLFVISAAEITARSYDGDASKFCDAIRSQETTEDTRQDTILRKSVELLSGKGKDAIAMVGLAHVELSREEAFRLIRVCPSVTSDAQAANALKELSRVGIIQTSGRGTIRIHDAFRPLAYAEFSAFNDDLKTQASQTLRDVLVDSFPTGDFDRFALFLDLLLDLGDVNTIVEMATDEMLHEIGGPDRIRDVLEEAAKSEALSYEKRYMAYDALIFWDARRGGRGQIDDYLLKMKQLIDAGGLGSFERVGLAMKKMHGAAYKKDYTETERCYEEAMAIAGDDTRLHRIIKYNFARELFQLRDYKRAARIAGKVAGEYFNLLKLSPSSVFRKSLEEIVALAAPTPRQFDDFKHLADALSLLAQSCEKAHFRVPPLARIHAMKFYHIAGAFRSLISVGQDLVDEYVATRNDWEGARQLMEDHILPVVRYAKLWDDFSRVRSQYAVVLAHVGERRLALDEIAKLEPYATTPARRQELANQRALIESVNAPRTLKPSRTTKIGRNEICPCGSGKKYKKCHGA